MKKYTKVSLVLDFLKGNVHLFIISIFSALAVTGLEMLSPQLIRTTVDSVIGNEPMDLPKFVLSFVDSIGGVEYLRNNLLLYLNQNHIQILNAGCSNHRLHLYYMLIKYAR